MKAKNCLIFGGSGQIGRHLIRKLTKNNYKVIAVTRSIHQKGYQIKTQSNYGYLELEEINSFDEENISRLMKKSLICINLIGILFEKKKNHFDLIHSQLPSLLSKLALKNSLEQFIHLSALGIESATDSKYASSKLSGETIKMPAHISFVWGADGKIVEEYHMYDTTEMIAAIEASTLAADAIAEE